MHWTVAFLARRAAVGILTLWAISVLVFIGTEILPGDLAEITLGQNATEETISALRRELGLDRPLLERYVDWIGGLLTGDLGHSLANEVPVADLVGPRGMNTLYLTIFTAAIAVPIALVLGVMSAAFPGGRFDQGVSTTTLFTMALPDFLIAIVLIAIFAVHLHWFPAILFRIEFNDIGNALYSMVLPVVTLTLTVLAYMIRMTRAAVMDVLSATYIEMAVLKGLPKWRIIVRHAIPNAVGPIVSVIALNLGYLINGVVVVEVVFSFPGLGRLMVDAIAIRDFPTVQATAMVFCAAYIGLNLIADLLMILSNPRLRHAR